MRESDLDRQTHFSLPSAAPSPMQSLLHGSCGLCREFLFESVLDAVSSWFFGIRLSEMSPNIEICNGGVDQMSCTLTTTRMIVERLHLRPRQLYRTDLHYSTDRPSWTTNSFNDERAYGCPVMLVSSRRSACRASSAPRKNAPSDVSAPEPGSSTV